MPDYTGQKFGNYLLEFLLGEGGFAQVYIGVHIHLRTEAAIKVLTSTLTSHEVEAFREEARTIMELEHPHIVRILDFGMQGSVPYLVMTRAPGGSLRQLHPKGSRVELIKVNSYIEQVASALQYSHDRKKIHRDVKPDNMLVGRNNEILLSDFGIATIAHSTHSLKTQDAPGTPYYNAPEQIQGKPRPASDQYALGIVVYEWLTGTWPFVGFSQIEIAMKHLQVPPPSLREKEPTVPLGVEEVVLKALAKEPGERFPSVLEFAEALSQAVKFNEFISLVKEYLANLIVVGLLEDALEPEDAQSLSREFLALLPSFKSIDDVINAMRTLEPRYSILKELMSDYSNKEEYKKRLAKLKVKVAVLRAARDILEEERASVSSPQAPTPQPAPLPPTIVAAAPPIIDRPLPVTGTLLLTLEGHTEVLNEVAWSPDGRRLASASSDKTLRLWDATSGKSLATLSGHTSPVVAVAWSPDSRYIASSSWRNKVHLWDAASGQPLFNLTDPTPTTLLDVVWAVAWSPDGRRLASATSGNTVQLWNPATGQPLATLTGHTKLVRGVAWSPDGRCLASASDDQTVRLWDATSGQPLNTLAGHISSVFKVAWSPDGRRLASASHDRTVCLWDATSGQPLATLTGHADPVTSVAWSPDGRCLASASGDQTVRLWDATSGQPLATLTGHTDVVCVVAWSPDGLRLASASSDKTVRVWWMG